VPIIDLKFTTIKISDGSTNSITVQLGEGNLTYDEHQTREFVKRRGELDTVRLGDQVPLDLAFQFVWTYIHAPDVDDPPTVEDALKGLGNASGWVSASTDPLAPYCVNVTVTYTPPCGGLPAEVIVFSQFHYTDLSHSLADATIDVKGQCNIIEAG
jgi:hypothetical protein